jgi:hypothetical protein
VSGFGGTRYGVFRSSAASDGGEPGPARLVEHGSHGGFFATILSAVALGFSGFSYYNSSLKTADLTVYVPPMIHYGRDGEADVFNIPITIANEGRAERHSTDDGTRRSKSEPERREENGIVNEDVISCRGFR